MGFFNDHTTIDQNKIIIEKIQSTHDSKNLGFNFDPMIDVIKRIFYHVELTNDEESRPTGSATFGFKDENNILRVIIHRLSWKIICKSACGKDEQEAVTELLQLVSSYTWEAKMVLIVGAFAMTYGQFWTNANFNSENHLAQPMCLLVKPPCLLQETQFRKLHFESLQKQAKKMLAVAVLMVNIKELSKDNKIQIDGSSTATTLQLGVYWMITSVYRCLSYNMNLVKMDNECSSWAVKIEEINYYTNILTGLHEKLEYTLLEERINAPHNSVVELISVFYEIGVSPQVNLDIFNGKTVAFFISYWDVKMENYKFLDDIYKKNNRKVEIVWIPIVEDWNTYNQKSFELLRNSMPWPTLNNPKSIVPAFLRYIQQQWHFQRKPILIFVDEKFQFINTDVLPSVEFHIDFTIQPVPWQDYQKPIWQLLNVNKQELVEGDLVCFYGGYDYEWIKKFEERISVIKGRLRKEDKMQMIYIGTKRAEEKLGMLIEDCKSIKGTTVFWGLDKINTFWRRLSYLYTQRLMNCPMGFLEDEIMKELTTISTYDYSYDGWVIMFGGSSADMVIASAHQLTQSLTNIATWGSGIMAPAVLLQKLKIEIVKSHTKHHCTSFTIPAQAINTDAEVRCFICNRRMEKSFVFKCCTD